MLHACFCFLVNCLTRRWRISGGRGIVFSGSIFRKRFPGEPTASDAARGGHENVPTCFDDSGVVLSTETRLHVLRSADGGALLDVKPSRRPTHHSLSPPRPSSNVSMIHQRLESLNSPLLLVIFLRSFLSFSFFAPMQHPEPTS